MKSLWFKLITYILFNNSYEWRRIKNGDFYSIKEQRIEGLSTSKIHQEILRYRCPRNLRIATTNVVLKRMRIYNLVKNYKLTVGMVTRYNPLARVAIFWKGRENFWFLTKNGQRYYYHTKNEIEPWIRKKINSYNRA